MRKLLRCAIYTRKSTDHNLDLEFNSLDAQREACEAYIKSQAHEGWRLIPSRYDDGAFSGASLERPALQKLVTEVRGGKIDIIVVYKVDRLTRSLSDFAKLVELFDAYAVSFVSVTQSFNTTSSMGRLTLNVLLSFAQFEREVIGERVRDKIAASKAKGIWVGGPVPLGYVSRNKKLAIVPEEAETVRFVFRAYLACGSLGALIAVLDRKGITTKRQELADGRIRGGIPFGLGALAHLLRNRFYVGEIVYRGAVSRGEHEPILDHDLFNAVQEKLSHATVQRRAQAKNTEAILTGVLYDDKGNRMTASHTNKAGARYRYYISQAILQKRPKEAGSVPRVAAPEIEALVTAAIEKYHAANPGTMEVSTEPRALITSMVERIVVGHQSLDIHRRPEPADGDIGTQEERGHGGVSGAEPPSRIISIPWSPKPYAVAKGILHTPSAAETIDPETRDAMLMAIAKARSWIGDLSTGKATSFADIANREGKVERHIRFLSSLAFLSPKVIAAIASGAVSPNLTITQLAKSVAPSWAEQERRLLTSC